MNEMKFVNIFCEHLAHISFASLITELIGFLLKCMFICIIINAVFIIYELYYHSSQFATVVLHFILLLKPFIMYCIIICVFKCGLLGFDTMLSCPWFPAFQRNILPASHTLEIETVYFSETLVTSKHENLKSHIQVAYVILIFKLKWGIGSS